MRVYRDPLTPGFLRVNGFPVMAVGAFCAPKKRLWARRLRHNPTPAEVAFWAVARRYGMGIKFRRQQVIFGYIADFYCPPLGLVVEIDGGYHRTPEQREYDCHRTAVMTRRGLQVLRFTNEEVFTDMAGVISRVRAAASRARQ